MLFFGCRHPDQDFLYADELKSLASGGITELFTAFSRGDGPKTYVQHVQEAVLALSLHLLCLWRGVFALCLSG